MISPQLPNFCTPTNSLLTKISATFHTCVPTPLALLSIVLGILSIVSWLFAQLPQLVKNYRLGSTAGLSVFFLAEWLMGDAGNLVGALLTGQASWQVVVAAYYLTVDVLLLCQYIWYTHLRSKQQARLEEPQVDTHRKNDDLPTEVLTGSSPPVNPRSSSLKGSKGMNDHYSKKSKPTPVQLRKGSSNDFRTFTSNILNEKPPYESDNPAIVSPQIRLAPTTPSPRIVLLLSTLNTVLTNAAPLMPSILSSQDHIVRSTSSDSSVEMVGRIFSWISTILYLGSRLPQIYKNHRRRSTSGLSAALFASAFCGNLFYSTSLIANPLAWSSYPPYGLHGWAGPEGSNRGTWRALAAPFWLGAAGVLAMDATIGIQFLKYGERTGKVVAVRDERERAEWKQVTGWMKGWVPSPSPRPVRDGNDERPLLAEARGKATRYGGI